MKAVVILICAIFIAFALSRRSKRTQASWFPRLKGWQKLFGVIAVILAVLMLMNPDFLALGFLADTTFFDVLVLALSLQMLVSFQWACRTLGVAVIKSLRWAAVRLVGLMVVLVGIYILFCGIAILTTPTHRIEAAPAWSYFLFSLIYLLVGVFSMRGARRFVGFAYPNDDSESDTKVAA